MRGLEFIAEIKGGGIVPPLYVRSFLRHCEGKQARIILGWELKKRSLDQNAYWFGVLDKHVVPVFRDYGDSWTAFKVHEYIMEELGYKEVLLDPQGKPFASRIHSSGFSTKQWEEFMERARALLATDHGIYVPLPNEGLPR